MELNLYLCHPLNQEIMDGILLVQSEHFMTWVWTYYISDVLKVGMAKILTPKFITDEFSLYYTTIWYNNQKFFL